MPTETKPKLWQAQQWDTDSQSWENMVHEGSQGTDRYTVEQEARYAARRCAYAVRTRVVRAD